MLFMKLFVNTILKFELKEEPKLIETLLWE